MMYGALLSDTNGLKVFENVLLYIHFISSYSVCMFYMLLYKVINCVYIMNELQLNLVFPDKVLEVVRSKVRGSVLSFQFQK